MGLCLPRCGSQRAHGWLWAVGARTRCPREARAHGAEPQLPAAVSAPALLGRELMDTPGASLVKVGGPCARSIPTEASKVELSWEFSLVGLGGPTVLKCLPTKIPWFGCPPGYPFINGTGHSTDGRGG